MGHRRGGERLKRIGTEARQELESCSTPVFLSCGSRCARAGPTTRSTCAATATSAARPADQPRIRRPAQAGRRPLPFVLHQLRLERVQPHRRAVHARARPLAVVAKGAKRPYSNCARCCCRSSACNGALSRTPARGQPRCRPAAQPRNGRRPPMPTGAALFAGFYLNELLLKLLARAGPHRRCSTPTPSTLACWASTTPAVSGCAPSSCAAARDWACCRADAAPPDPQPLVPTPLPSRCSQSRACRRGRWPTAGGGAAGWRCRPRLLPAACAALRAPRLPPLAPLSCRCRLLHYHLGKPCCAPAR